MALRPGAINPDGFAAGRIVLRLCGLIAAGLCIFDLEAGEPALWRAISSKQGVIWGYWELPQSDLEFRSESGESLSLAAFESLHAARPMSVPLPAWLLTLRTGETLPAQLLQIEEDTLTLAVTDPYQIDKPYRITIPRGLVDTIRQPHGRHLVLHEEFTTQLTVRPKVAAAEADNRLVRQQVDDREVAILERPGQVASWRLPQPVANGELRLAFYVPEGDAIGPPVRLSLVFESATVDFELAGPSDLYQIRSHGPCQHNMQLLRRIIGWHQLRVAWQAGRLRAAIDRYLLAEGTCDAGPLVSCAIQSLAQSAATGPRPIGPLPGVARPFAIDELSVLTGDASCTEAMPHGLKTPRNPLDQVLFLSGDRWYGHLQGAIQDGFACRGVFGKQRVEPRAVRSWGFARQSVPTRTIRGMILEMETGPGEVLACRGLSPDGDNSTDRWLRELTQLAPVIRLYGAYRGMEDGQILLEHPYLGMIRFPVVDLAHVRIVGSKSITTIDPGGRQFVCGRGSSWLDRAASERVGSGGNGATTNSLVIPFELDVATDGLARLCCEVQLEQPLPPARGDGSKKRRSAREGVFQTYEVPQAIVRLDGIVLGDVLAKASTLPIRVELPIGRSPLTAGRHQLEITLIDSGSQSVPPAVRLRAVVGWLGPITIESDLDSK